jgi:hypothetical protein
VARMAVLAAVGCALAAALAPSAFAGLPPLSPSGSVSDVTTEARW